MPQIWKHNLSNHFRLGHLIIILSLLDNKLEAPQAIGFQAEPTANGWTIRVAEERERPWEEGVVGLLRGVAFFPQGKIWMRFRRWEVDSPVQGDP